jgi:hypothetical protein
LSLVGSVQLATAAAVDEDGDDDVGQLEAIPRQKRTPWAADLVDGDGDGDDGALARQPPMLSCSQLEN